MISSFNSRDAFDLLFVLTRFSQEACVAVRANNCFILENSTVWGNEQNIERSVIVITNVLYQHICVPVFRVAILKSPGLDNIPLFFYELVFAAAHSFDILEKTDQTFLKCCLTSFLKMQLTQGHASLLFEAACIINGIDDETVISAALTIIQLGTDADPVDFCSAVYEYGPRVSSHRELLFVGAGPRGSDFLLLAHSFLEPRYPISRVPTFECDFGLLSDEVIACFWTATNIVR